MDIIVRRDGLEKKIVQGRMEGKRSRGRPAMGWTDDIKRWTGSVKTPITTMANNRDGWRTRMKATAALFSASDYEAREGGGRERGREQSFT